MIMSGRSAKNLNWAGALGLACLGLALLPVPVRAQQTTPGGFVPIQVQPAKKTPMSVDEQIETLRRALELQVQPAKKTPMSVDEQIQTLRRALELQVQPAKKTPMSVDERIEALRRVLLEVQPARKTPMSVDERIEALRRVLQQLEEQKRKEQGQPAEKTSPKDTKTEQKVLTPAEAIKLMQRPKEKVTVQFKVTAARTFQISKSNVVGKSAGFSEGCVLKDGDSFCVQLLPPAMDTIRRLGIEPDKHFKGKVVQVTGLLQPGQPDFGTGQFQIVVNDLTQIEVMKE